MLKEVIYLLKDGKRTLLIQLSGAWWHQGPVCHHPLAAQGRPNRWLPSHSPRVTLSPDTPVMRTSSADLTMFLRNPPKTSFLFFSRTLS